MKSPTRQHIAVKAVIPNDRGAVLLLQQSDPKWSGHMQFHTPGGIVELGESLEESLVREIREELNVNAKVGKLLDVQEWRAKGDGHENQFFGVFFVCKVDKFEFKLQKSEIAEAVWIDKDNFDEHDILEPTKSVIKAYLAATKH